MSLTITYYFKMRMKASFLLDAWELVALRYLLLYARYPSSLLESWREWWCCSLPLLLEVGGREQVAGEAAKGLLHRHEHMDIWAAVSSKLTSLPAAWRSWRLSKVRRRLEQVTLHQEVLMVDEWWCQVFITFSLSLSLTSGYVAFHSLKGSWVASLLYWLVSDQILEWTLFSLRCAWANQYYWVSNCYWLLVTISGTILMSIQ